jgi:hypothetical protein
MFAQIVNRTKMFHVKHFGTIAQKADAGRAPLAAPRLTPAAARWRNGRKSPGAPLRLLTIQMSIELVALPETFVRNTFWAGHGRAMSMP